MPLLGVHFGKIQVKLLNQFHEGGEKKTLLPFKDHYINVADHHQPCLSSTEATKLKYTHAAYFLHIVRKLALKYRVCFQQMEQQN